MPALSESPHLTTALALQSQARDLIARRDREHNSPAWERDVLRWSENRLAFAAAIPENALDGLILAHGMSQALSGLANAIATDDADASAALTLELQTALASLTGWLTIVTGLTADALALHSNFTGPVPN